MLMLTLMLLFYVEFEVNVVVYVHVNIYSDSDSDGDSAGDEDGNDQHDVAADVEKYDCTANDANDCDNCADYERCQKPDNNHDHSRIYCVNDYGNDDTDGQFCNADNYNDGNMLIENHVQNISKLAKQDGSYDG